MRKLEAETRVSRFILADAEHASRSRLGKPSLTLIDWSLSIKHKHMVLNDQDTNSVGALMTIIIAMAIMS